MLWWGAKDFMLEQIARLKTDDFERFLSLGNLLHSYKIDEYLGGLNAIAKNTGDGHARSLLDDAVERSWAYFGDPDLGMAEFFDLDTRTRSPFFSPWAAGLLETFLELYNCDATLQRRVENVLDRWWSHPYVRATGIFPFRGSFEVCQQMAESFWAWCGRWTGEPPIRWEEKTGSFIRDVARSNKFIYRARRLLWRWGASGHWSQLMKSNTTPLFAAIALYTRTNDVKWRQRIQRWFDGVRASFINQSGIHGASGNGRPLGVPSLVAGFIMIDVACDAWWYVDREASLLELARTVAKQCLEWRWESGLIPMTPEADYNHLDGQIDFALALRRLGELMGDEYFLKESIALLKATLAMHNTNAGYCTHIRRDGSIVELPKNTIDPKYNGLVLKGLVSLATLQQPIYEAAGLHDLFKDR